MRFLLAPVLLAACAPQPRVETAGLATIAMDRNSWGHPVSGWSIDAAGNGRYALVEPDAFQPERMVTRGFAAGSMGFASLRATLARAEARAGSALHCGDRITDQFYGTLRWGSATLAYDMGCQDPATRVLLGRITAAERQVAEWAAKGPILETKEVERQ